MKPCWKGKNAGNQYFLIFVQSFLSISPFSKQALVFTCVLYKSLENTVRQGEIAHNEQFLLFPQCFLPFQKTVCHFQQIWNCCLQTLPVWKSPKFFVWERVKDEFHDYSHTGFVIYKSFQFRCVFIINCIEKKYQHSHIVISSYLLMANTNKLCLYSWGNSKVHQQLFNLSSDYKILDLSTFKQIADDILKCI